jgi:peptidoglycan/LPS O-acetylase OafA/YrhL
MAIFLVQLLQVYQSRLWCWLESPVLRHIGLLSYSLYLWHGWGLTIGRHVRFAGVGGQFAAGLIVCFVLASVSYYLVERPFLALKAHFEPASVLATSSPRADPRPR